MSSVLLVYPFFRRSLDRSRFRFPPLGPAYVAASVRRAGHDVRLLDCTFLSREQALRLALAARADVVGVYCMATMREDATWFARQLRGRCELLVAGGPLPTCEPETFLADFDVVVRGEGEQTMVDVLAAHASGADLGRRARRGRRGGGRRRSRRGPPRPFAADLDALPFPARDLLPNAAYISHGRRRYGYAVTTVMSSRGCPFACEFCSNVVFGSSYRERSPASVVDEIEQALALGYDRIAFSDDVFTMRPERVVAVCDEIERRGLRFAWECLARVDGVDRATAGRMRRAGCRTVFFGIESGSDEVLRVDAQGHHGGPGSRRRLGRPRRRPRGRRLLHPVLPRRDRRHGARDPALRPGRCRWTTSVSRCRTPCRARPCGSGWRAASRASRGPTAAS